MTEITIETPTFWSNVILWSCPSCNHECLFDDLLLITRKYSDYHGKYMYFSKCPYCGKEHVMLH